MLDLNRTTPGTPEALEAPWTPWTPWRTAATAATRWPLREQADSVRWNDPYVLADRAFDLTEAGQLGLARALAERALAIAPRSPDAAHSLAHVFSEEGDAAGGSAFLGAWLTDYDPSAPDASHLACHLAQFEIRRGRAQRARRVFDERLDATRVSRVRLRDAAAVLWRLHLAGERDLPWHTAQELAHPTIEHPQCPLDASHTALLLAGLGDDSATARLVQGLQRLALAGDSTSGSVVLPLTLGVKSYAQGRFAAAARLLAPVQAGLPRLGGSNVQRGIFRETLERAHAQTGRARAMAVHEHLEAMRGTALTALPLRLAPIPA